MASRTTPQLDLWAKEPWYNRGDGTITFAGGSTKPGGFVGDGVLLTVWLKGKNESVSKIQIEDAQILKHDGLGTETSIKPTIESIFNIYSAETKVEEKQKTDLNNDGKTDISDISIFMLNLTTQNKQSDFNGDGKVGPSDLSIILDKINK